MNWNYLEIAELLHASATRVLTHRRNLSWNQKKDDSLVTAVDRENEAFLRENLTRQGDFFLGEESIEGLGHGYLRDALRGPCFVVDPIDGTAPFAHGFPLWGISIGHLQHGRLDNGAVILPELDECLLSQDGGVHWAKNISGPPSTWQWLEIPYAEKPWSSGDMLTLGQQFTRAHRDLPFSNPLLTSGSAVQALASIVTGHSIAYVGVMKLWDIAGMLPILEALSIEIRLWDGTPVTCALASGVFDLDFASPHCWRFRDDLYCGTAAFCSQFRRYLETVR
ncbi:MAG: hypothetical protein IJJ33_03655 [Victivallales bacterium]|nr:hypothetical protein [Victivallales bacterium]